MTTIDHMPTAVNTSAIVTTHNTDMIVSDLLNAIRRHTKNAGANWNAATTLEDVGIDSFDLVELIFDIEDKYGISVSFNANKTAESLLTVGDVAHLIADELDKKGRVA